MYLPRTSELRSLSIKLVYRDLCTGFTVLVVHHCAIDNTSSWLIASKVVKFANKLRNILLLSSHQSSINT